MSAPSLHRESTDSLIHDAEISLPSDELLARVDDSELSKFTCYVFFKQGVVTYMLPVEAFATGIKMESSDQDRFKRQSSDQGRFTRQSSDQGRFTRQSSDQDEFRVMINRSK